MTAAEMQRERRRAARLLKCAVCGRFTSYADLEAKRATIRLVTPDSDFSSEAYETLCRDHVDH